MMTIAIWAVVVLTSVANPTAVYKGTTIASSKAGQSTKVAYNCHELRALTLDGVSQALRCEPEHGVAEDVPAATSHRCHEIRALTLNGVSQVVRCEPEHGVADSDHAAISRRFSDVGK